MCPKKVWVFCAQSRYRGTGQESNNPKTTKKFSHTLPHQHQKLTTYLTTYLPFLAECHIDNPSAKMPPKSPSTSRRNLLLVHDGPETADSERTHKGLWPFSRMSDKTQISLLLLMLYVSVITSCILLIVMPQPDSLVATLSKYVLAVVMGSAFTNTVNLYVRSSSLCVAVGRCGWCDWRLVD
jgi:hypothetical protein